jgi:hypothetical protein
MLFCALLTTLSGALLIYLSHPQQRLRRAVLPAAMRTAGTTLLGAGTAAWCMASGIGAGVAGAMTTMMFAWVALPYLAWWRGNPTPAARKTQP